MRKVSPQPMSNIRYLCLLRSENICWTSTKTSSSQRFIVVFNNELTFNKIIVNNYHHVGGLSEIGLKNVKITITDEVITNTTPNEFVTGGRVIFDDVFEQHTAVDEVQDWEVPLI